ncbi:hypothetical protein R0137_13435 [Congregibacter brevis]|uniref:Tetratricopeptide repeat protein n=1 Tax=Congregibacter brevis TaxID=3081201 RepID=A0ABZ0IDX8_9GAMM|nr:hypothetical protein R0137_13435 [Congregibacter sp. IMCC45268]
MTSLSVAISRLRTIALIVGIVGVNSLVSACGGSPREPGIPYIPEALGPYTWPISTGSEEAQAYFNQGMQLRYGYSMSEAARSMAEARSIDPNCAICFWGEAFALGSFLNQPMTEENAPLAHEAITKAAALKDRASAVEAALIDAAVVRYPAKYDPDGRRSVDEAFASAMAEVYAQFPDHTEVTTVYSIALFLLEDRRGYRDLTDPDLQKLHGLLKSVIAKDHAHPGACHLYIHATESTSQPELGLPCAETLGSAVPGASHIQHMPSHAWNEVGLWRRSVDANLRAWQADRAALNDAGFSYGPSHNLHMLVFASSFDGQSTIAVQAGDDYETETGNPLYAMLTRVRFGRYGEILEHDARPAEKRDAAFYDFARGYAHLRRGDVARAKELRDSVLSYAENTSDRFRFHDASTLLGVLGNLLAGEILISEGDSAGALEAFQTAVSLEDSLGYDEPEPLPFAARHWLGAALLESGAYTEAELAYRTELANHPHNGWSLFGLQQALSAQDKIDPKVDLDLAASWARSAVELKSSRF